MPFAFSDAGSTFQPMVHTIFVDLIQKGVVVVYLDDIVVHTRAWPGHLKVLDAVLR